MYAVYAHPPIQIYVEFQEMWETEMRLLHFAEHGEVAKKSGQRGDKTEVNIPPNHSEL